ncbi:MAG: hypothetical protein ACLFTT_09325 [Candidatus Hydrogenedentota bacterium]
MTETVTAHCLDCGAPGDCPACLQEVYRCQACGDAAWVARQAERRAQEARDLASQRRGRLALLQDAGLLRESTRHMRLDSLTVDSDNRNAIQAAREWLTGGGRGLWLHGPPGTGKSFLGRTLLGEHYGENARLIAEVSAPRFLRVSRDWESGELALSRLARVDLLLVDDLDKARWNDSGLASLWRLCDDRCEGRRRSIVTSNVPARVLIQRCAGDLLENWTAAVDRLKPLTTVKLDGPSRRDGAFSE